MLSAKAATKRKPGTKAGFSGVQTGSERMSGKEQPLLVAPPLRTVQASFPAYGSSLYKPVPKYRPATSIKLSEARLDLLLLQLAFRISSPDSK